MTKQIPFNRPAFLGAEQKYIARAIENRKLSGEGEFNQKSSKHIAEKLQAPYVTLTPSCTAALEMAYLTIDLKPGDEVIMPSFTFTSTATAAVLFGATPVFVDVDDTFNINLDQVAQVITEKTRAICVVHYAGMSCDMDRLRGIIGSRDIYVIEDAAQAYEAKYKDRYLGSFGDIAAFSFHETKNIISGEGGALIVNNPALIKRAEIVRDKGTNRQIFLRGEVDKYTWQEKGSSYLLGELPAAYLLAQLEHSHQITKKRLSLWAKYQQLLQPLMDAGTLSIPTVPEYAKHNAHIFYIVTNDEKTNQDLIASLKKENIYPHTHYIPLHLAPAGIKYGKAPVTMPNTESKYTRLLRLPLYYDLSLEEVKHICQCINHFFKKS